MEEGREGVEWIWKCELGRMEKWVWMEEEGLGFW